MNEPEVTRILRAHAPAESTGVLIIRILSGELRGSEAILLGEEPFIIGSAFDATLRLPDSSVSRRHIELVNQRGKVLATDLDSTNGCFLEGTRFSRVELGPGAIFRVGETELQILAPEKTLPLMPSEQTAFGPLLGKSRRMREVFSILERAAKSDATVLVTGETGTGKEVVAHAIHEASPRASGPFVVVDCASIPATLIESELFGHLKGAYTNALTDRVGAFEAANGGTIFLDELGELPAALQGRLLRVLETRRVKPIGANDQRPVDVRVIAATNRSLEDEVRARRFRSDLYFRLAVLRVALPPLRERREDIPLLAEAFVARARAKAGADAPANAFELTPEMIAVLQSHDWPGNVRELRNVLDQATSLSSADLSLALRLRGDAAPRDPEVKAALAGAALGDFFGLPYKEARRQALEAFELAYAQHAVGRAGGNITRAAEQAQVHRNVLHRILARARGGSGGEAPMEENFLPSSRPESLAPTPSSEREAV